MNKIISTAVVTGLFSLVAIPAMAAPFDYGHRDDQSQLRYYHDNSGHTRRDDINHFDYRFNQRYRDSSDQDYYRIQPHRDWHNGQILDAGYLGQPYRIIDYRQHYGLYEPGYNQQWVQVNDDYILINTLSNVIVSILTGR